jgi:hypothetical protein
MVSGQHLVSVNISLTLGSVVYLAPSEDNQEPVRVL